MNNISYFNSDKTVITLKDENCHIPNNGNCRIQKSIKLGMAFSIFLPLQSMSSNNVSFSYNNITLDKKDCLSKNSKLDDDKDLDFRKIVLCDDIRELNSLEENWDGYGAVRVFPKCISNALNLINYHTISCEKIQDIYANPNGTISIEWENKQNESIGLEIGKDSLSYYVELNETPIFKDKLNFTQETYEELSLYINQL